MRLLRRSLTVAVALPLWIVMILTGGQWCLMPGNASAHPVVSSAVRLGHAAVEGAHAAERGAHAPAASHDHGAAAATHGGKGGDGSHLSHHQQGGRACESQTACSVVIAPAALQLTEGGTPAPWQPAASPGTPPASRSLAPELPPPRA